ncbi:lipocalin family protein [uncultured Croceitalea sp.]|uniref:lipocalin family protein n=1 Tax=uncultured Croceitalea sp. TaxID=1798908 RepID=UPI003306459A
MKKYIIIIFFLLFLSCSTDKNSMVGKWEIISLQSERGNELKEGDYIYTYELKKDGTYVNHFEDDILEGKWTINSKNKTIEFDEGFKVVKGSYQLNSTILSLEVKKYLGEMHDTTFGAIFIELQKLN